MEKKFKESKFSLFMKKNIYLILMIVCLVAIIGMIAYTFATQQPEDSGPATSVDDNKQPDSSTTQTPVDKPNDNQDDNQNNSTPTVLTEIDMPIKEVEILKDYTDTELVFNATMKHWATHQGVDFKTEVGTKVYAVFDGTVTEIATTTLKGTSVTIKHSNGFESVYSLLDSNVNVKIGDTVKRGDLIGVVGESGVFESADGPHLHFEFKKDGDLVDPNYYFDGANK